MQHRQATLLAVLATALAGPLAATATADTPDAAVPQERVLIRTEGKDKTLFEGPVLTRGHAVQAISDTTSHPCDGTNNDANPEPGPTPTAASVDGQTLVGRPFDAKWYPGFDDYYLTQFGPDHEIVDEGQFWGILVNGNFTPVGGCQYQLNRDDVALWVYDAFGGRTQLRLDGPEGIGEPVSPGDHEPSFAPVESIFTVALGAPLTVHVRSLSDQTPPEDAAGLPDVGVSPVATDPTTGDETVLIDDPATVVTGADGSASISWSTPGWKRIKADGGASTIRSNRLDVCVRTASGGDCGPKPDDVKARTIDPPTFAATSADLGDVALTTTGAPRTIELPNRDAVPLVVRAVRTTGPQAADFVVDDGPCTAAPVAPGASCAVTVRLAPTALGARTAKLEAVLPDVAATPTVALQGNGAPAPPQPATSGPTPAAAATPAGPVLASPAAASRWTSSCRIAAGGRGARRALPLSCTVSSTDGRRLAATARARITWGGQTYASGTLKALKPVAGRRLREGRYYALRVTVGGAPRTYALLAR